MKRRLTIEQFFFVQLLGITGVIALTPGDAQAVDPNPLQNAYWRFEEGPVDQKVPNSPSAEVSNIVIDSTANDNDLSVYRTFSAPTYRNFDLPPTPLKSGQPNTLALEFIDTVAGQDLYTTDRQIDNGIIDPGNGFTLEASFNVYDTSIFRAIVAKEGRPGLAAFNADPNYTGNTQLPTLALKTRGPEVVDDPNQGKLSIQLFDGAANLVTIDSLAPVSIGQWYNAAVVNDGTTLSLYLDSNDSNGYVLQGQAPVDGALFQGLDSEDPSWDHSWTFGRGQFNGSPGDFFLGMIDEVRLTNSALSPSQFLFAPPGGSADFDEDGDVDGADFLTWQRGVGIDDGSANLEDGDATGEGNVDGADLVEWKAQFGPTATVVAGPVPEPSSIGLAALAAAGVFAARRRQRR
jgi:hypothetical protein